MCHRLFFYYYLLESETKYRQLAKAAVSVSEVKKRYRDIPTRNAFLKNLGILKNKGREKGRRVQHVLSVGTVLVGVLRRGVLKRAAVEHASVTLGNSLWLRSAGSQRHVRLLCGSRHKSTFSATPTYDTQWNPEHPATRVSLWRRGACSVTLPLQGDGAPQRMAFHLLHTRPVAYFGHDMSTHATVEAALPGDRDGTVEMKGSGSVFPECFAALSLRGQGQPLWRAVAMLGIPCLVKTKKINRKAEIQRMLLSIHHWG